jgi:hypothetical protein
MKKTAYGRVSKLYSSPKITEMIKSKIKKGKMGGTCISFICDLTMLSIAQAI